MTTLSAHLKSWHPDRPVSKGATAYHNAVVNASWHIENINELIKIVSKKIKDNSIVVDFGAGTGSSSLYLLQTAKVKFKLWLVDNSASWLSKAYELFSRYQNVNFFLLEKINNSYTTLAEAIGEGVADHVVSANTVHLIPNLEETFKGINRALKQKGCFTFQSGNIIRRDREEGILMIDDTVKILHDIALKIIRTNKKFAKYRKNLGESVETASQRKLIFPDPRPIEIYLKMLKAAGFEYNAPHHKLIKVKYKDWLDFIRVKRLQAGILPELGGKETTPEEEQDRDELITLASKKMFKELETRPFADNKSFTAEWVYLTATKER